jgi:DNA-binding transcriptional ArsR family regulator
LYSKWTTIVVRYDNIYIFMDIFKITKSKTREKILRHYFSDPEKKYYLRELEKLLDLPVGNIRRELISLYNFGLFKKEKTGNLVYYLLNKQAVMYDDLKNIVFKTIGVEGEIKKVLKKFPGIKKAFIFGSFAKNKENSASDIDLMIVGSLDEDVLIKKSVDWKIY